MPSEREACHLPFLLPLLQPRSGGRVPHRGARWSLDGVVVTPQRAPSMPRGRGAEEAGEESEWKRGLGDSVDAARGARVLVWQRAGYPEKRCWIRHWIRIS